MFPGEKKKKLINPYLSMKSEMISMERISQLKMVAADEKSLNKKWQKGRQKKKKKELWNNYNR